MLFKDQSYWWAITYLFDQHLNTILWNQFVDDWTRTRVIWVWGKRGDRVTKSLGSPCVHPCTMLLYSLKHFDATIIILIILATSTKSAQIPFCNKRWMFRQYFCWNRLELKTNALHSNMNNRTLTTITCFSI